MRAKLATGEQHQFINTILRINNWTIAELARRCGIGKTTLVYWRQERHSIPLSMLQRLSVLAGIPHPEIEQLIDDKERRRYGGRVAQKNRQEVKIYNSILNNQKSVHRPNISPQLAEFIGIMLGDGGIAEYQVNITSNLHEEEEYAHFIAQQALELFGIESTLQKRPDHGACSVVLSSRELVLYLQELGLVQGNKVEQQCAIPDWIFEDIELMRGCVRGLMDTDGCVYHHGYAINGKRYNYIKMTFASRSWPLMEGIQRIWRELGLTPGAVRTRGYISLSSDKEVRRYYEELVGTHNPYHWRRYCAAVEATKK